MKNHNPIGLIVLIFTFTLSFFICESQAENLPPIYLLLLGGRGVSDTIGPAGGNLEISDTEGNVYRLIVPAGALTSQKLITIKPLTSVKGFASQLSPLSNGLALFPQGLTFSSPIKLEIVLSQDTVIPSTPAIYLEEETGKPGILLEVVQSGQKLTASLEHFSNAIPVGGIGAMGLQLYINSAMQIVSQWESNCTATSQMAEKRNFYEDSLASETLVLQMIQLWGLGGDFGFEHRTSGVDFCGDLFDHQVTYINICYDGTCWPPVMGNVDMAVNDQRQFNYEIVCVNGFCQGDVIWFIPRIPLNEPPLASVTQGGMVAALRVGTGELQAFSKEFSNINVPDIIQGNIGLDVTNADITCFYYETITTDSKSYRKQCYEGDQQIGYISQNLYLPDDSETTSYFEDNKSTEWQKKGIPESPADCDAMGGNPLFVNRTILTDTQGAILEEYGWTIHSDDVRPKSFRHILGTISTSTECWPEYVYYPTVNCGSYACPSITSIVPLHPYPGDCHQWWDHYDDEGNWIQCSL